MQSAQIDRPTGFNGKELTLAWDKQVPDTQLEKFQKTVEERYKEHFESYFDFHKWSVENFSGFWEEVWKYLNPVHSETYNEVYRKTGESVFECEWFPGAKLNFAENLLRIRDDSVAIIFADEDGNEERITFSDLLGDVTVFAAAFRKHGLKVGDRVACYMHNRKETVCALLAATSIGAIFGGPLPSEDTEVAARIIQEMNPKFLIAVDHFDDVGAKYNIIDNLAEVVKGTPSLDCVVIVPTTPGTLSRNISNIRNSLFLSDFLRSARSEDGSIPDLVFEQLPVGHPICINFKSGNAGHPRGAVHSAGYLLSQLTNLVFNYNLQKGDILFAYIPLEVSLWGSFISCLACGVTLLSYVGDTLFEESSKVEDCKADNEFTRKSTDSNVWDVFSEFKVTHAFIAPEFLDKFEMPPNRGIHLKALKLIAVGGSGGQTQGYLFQSNKITRNVFVGLQYSAPEFFGTLFGFNLNVPCYTGELQIPALGVDLLCFDEKGNSVVNERGAMVLRTPCPSLPIYILNDKDNQFLKEYYLSKYTEVWEQREEIWINPTTKGTVVLGRRAI